MSEQQHDIKVLNYLYWLRDRGQVFVPEARESAVTEPKTEAKTSLTAIRLLFVSADELTSAEREMVQRIGSALGLSSELFKLVTEAEAAQFAPNFVVAMGPVKIPHAQTLLIPHPRKMLAQPQLKVSAWENLQRLKSLLS